MKNLPIFITLLLLSPFATSADPRIEEECHFPYDGNNADNEEKVQNCTGATINTYDDGNGERAFGSVTYTKRYSLLDGVAPKFAGDSYLRGETTTSTQYETYEVLANSDCVMVTKNYNNGQYNYTEYRTRDFDVTALRSDYDFEDRSYTVTFKDVCRNGIAQ